MFEDASIDEIIEALEGQLGPEAEANAVWGSINGDFGEELQERVLVNAVQGHHGEGFREEAVDIATDLGLIEQWQEEAQQELEADPEHQQQLEAAAVVEAEERMTALVAAEKERVEARFGPLNQREYDALLDAIPDGVFDGVTPFPDLVASFGPQLEQLRDRSTSSKREDLGEATAIEMLAQRDAEEADESGRTRIERHLHGDDPIPEEGTHEDRVEAGVRIAKLMQLDDAQLDAAQAETQEAAAAEDESGAEQ